MSTRRSYEAERAARILPKTTLRCSRRLFVLRLPECVGIYHAVFGTAHFISHSLFRVFTAFRKPVDRKSWERLRRRCGASREEFYNLLVYLYRHGIIQVSESEEARYIRNVRKTFDDVPRAYALYLFPTYDCNLRCAYCFVRKAGLASSTKRLGFSTARKAIELLSRDAPYAPEPQDIIFYGGEPLINFGLVRKVVEYVSGLDPHRFFCGRPPRLSINTNGMLIDDDVADFCRAYDMTVAVSIDADRLTHDRLRRGKGGEATYDKVVKALHILRKKGVRYNLSVTLTKLNIGVVPKLVRQMAEEFDCRLIGLNYLLYNESGDDLFAGPPGYTRELDAIYDVMKRYGVYEINYERMKGRIKAERPIFWHCDALGGQMVVLPDGATIPCQGLVGMKEYEVALKGKERPMGHEVYRRWRRRTPWNMKECAERCDILSACGGRCAYNALRMRGNIMHPVTRDCDIAHYLFQRAFADLTRELWRQRSIAPGSAG